MVITGPASSPSPSNAWSIHSTDAEPPPYLRDSVEEEGEPACLEFYTRRKFGKTQLETCAPLSHTWALLN